MYLFAVVNNLRTQNMQKACFSNIYTFSYAPNCFLMPSPTGNCDTFYEITQLTISIHTIYNIAQVSMMESLRSESVPHNTLEIS